MGRPLLQGISPSTSSLNDKSSESHRKNFLMTSLILGGLTILLILLLSIFVFRNFIRPLLATRKPVVQGRPEAFGRDLRTLICFDYYTLKKATKNFHQSHLLGKGGFGPVYRGKLEDGRLVAVKCLSLDKSQQGQSEFVAEVRMITSIQHKNLVRLLGYCSDGSQRLLVYEYMKNGSLDQIIYVPNGLSLNWKTRFQIVVGVARGLQYLHEDSHLRIVHRDIKASNILLDEKLHPKIGDFGLARFFPEDQAYLSTNFAGTLGYTAPEYAIRGELSEKADIYSFGVLVLEIISCRKNTDLSLPSGMQYLPEYAWKLYEHSKVIELVDHRIRGEGFMEKDALRAIHVAFLCLQPHPKLRPPMSEVVAMLTCKAEIIGTPITRPQFFETGHRKNDQSLSWDSISDLYPSQLHIQRESSIYGLSHQSPPN